jgi:hypothetical protein
LIPDDFKSWVPGVSAQQIAHWIEDMTALWFITAWVWADPHAPIEEDE